MNGFGLVFLAALTLAAAVEWWLNGRQLRSVRAHRDRVPDPFATRISLASHRKAADYTSARLRTGHVALAYNTVLLLAWTLGGGLNLIDVAWREFEIPPLVAGACAIASALLINSLLQLPFAIYHTFIIEQRFGFNRMTPALFAADLLKGLLLAAIIGIPLIFAALWLMAPSSSDGQTDPLWWLYAWSGWLAFALLMSWLYPLVIAPLFNRFSPLSNADIERRIGALLERTGFTSRGVFVMDGSRRSAHGNAYFTGFGRGKRIVFFDTLMELLGPDEIEAVLAHELGHFKRRHVAKRIALASLGGLAAALILDWLLRQPGFYAGLGLEHASNHGALLLFMFVAPVFGTFLNPLTATLSRRHEYEADAFAAREANADHLISALIKLYEDNAATLTPDPCYSAFHYSHPPASARIARLAALAGSRSA
ncbi:MAG: M48 family metallopeptidase [Gammaproteobacteria bacterium]|nr:M48 family metallopeptidase [Gammaproteobacteria bacterium]